MVDQAEVEWIAAILVKRHGTGAEAEAELRAEVCRWRRNSEGAAVWERIAEVIRLWRERLN